MSEYIDEKEIFAKVSSREISPEQALALIKQQREKKSENVNIIRNVSVDKTLPIAEENRDGLKKIERLLRLSLANILKIDKDKIMTKKDFEAYGIDSIRIIKFNQYIKETFQIELEYFEILENNTIEKLATHIKQLKGDVCEIAGKEINFEEKNSREESHTEESDKSDKIKQYPPEKEKWNGNITIQREKITIIGAKREFDNVEFVNFWDRIRQGKIDNLTVSHVSKEYLGAIEKAGYKYLHLMVENDCEDQVETYIAGTGKPLIIVTGVGMTPGFCVHQIEELSQSRKVICVNMPGVGLSKLISDLSLTRLAKYIMETLKAVGIEDEIDLIGVSWGTLVTCTIAHEYPDIIGKMILVSPNSNMGKNKHEVDYSLGLERSMKNDFYGVKGGEEAYELFIKSKCINIRAFALYGRYFSSNTPSQHVTFYFLHEIFTPTLIIYGELDKIIKFEDSEQVYYRMPEADIIRMKDAGHVPLVTHYKEFNKIAKDFFKIT